MVAHSAIDHTGLGSLVKLFDSTLGATATSIDTGAVLGGHDHLRIIFLGRSDRAGQVFEGVNIRFNADTGANYDSINSDFFGTADQVDVGEVIGGTSAQCGSITGATGVANTPGGFVIDVPNYSATVFHKTFVSLGGIIYANSTTNLHNVMYSGKWRSTAAITRVTLLTRNTTNFIVGTRLMVYGLS